MGSRHSGAELGLLSEDGVVLGDHTVRVVWWRREGWGIGGKVVRLGEMRLSVGYENSLRPPGCRSPSGISMPGPRRESSLEWPYFLRPNLPEVQVMLVGLGHTQSPAAKRTKPQLPRNSMEMMAFNPEPQGQQSQMKDL